MALQGRFVSTTEWKGTAGGAGVSCGAALPATEPGDPPATATARGPGLKSGSHRRAGKQEGGPIDWPTVRGRAQRLSLLPVVAAAAVLAAHEAMERSLPESIRFFWLNLVVALGVIAFVAAVSQRLLRGLLQGMKGVCEREVTHVRHLDALSASALVLASDLDLASVLQKVVDLSRLVIAARYGAIAVVGPDGVGEQFLTSGIDPATRARLGPPPTGKGVLGVVIAQRRPLRLDAIASHPRSLGFPPGHPKMKTLLAVPLTLEDQVIGSLYVSEREDGAPFSVEDQETLQRFAAHAAIAVMNAHLYQQAKRVSAVEERERIAMDLHDGVLQSLFGISLTLESCSAHVATDQEAARREVSISLEHLAQVARDVRAYVNELRGIHLRTDGLAEAMRRLLDSQETGSVVDKRLVLRGDFLDVPQQAQWALLHVVHEAVSNAVRHGGARRIDVHLMREDGSVHCAVQDDGVGFDHLADLGEQHNGLRNMRQRVEALSGHLTVLSAIGRGTTVIAEVPV